MSRFKELMKRKLISIDEAVHLIKSNDDVVVAQCASEPQGCMAKFHVVAPQVENVRVFSVLTLKPYDFYAKNEMKGHFELCSWFHAPGSRQALAAGTGTVTYVPNMLHRAAIDRIHARRPDLFFGTCTPMDAKGFVSLSLGLTYEKDILEAARHVVLEINENLPRTFGDTQVHVTEVDNFVEYTSPVPTLPEPKPTDVERAIGQHVADLVPDEATIQLGIGGIPNAVALALEGKRGLGVHTEMLVDSMVDLWERGVIDNRHKALLKGKFVCTFAMGSRRLYDWLHDNLAVEFRRGAWVNDPAVIRQNSKMTSLNTCLMVDLTGQVASESIGPRQYSGTGGQADTAAGARDGFDGLGKSIIACASTARDGAVSTIVPLLPEGTAVTLHRSDADHIVTEFGVAFLRGRTVRERAQALIAIAHPQFRDALASRARALDYL